MAKNNNDNIDLIRGDPKIAIRKLAVPTMMSMLFIMLYNIADSLWVAGLGSDALAALGFISPLFFIIVGVGNGVGVGANSLIARAIGQKNKQLADNAASHSIVITIILSILAPIIIIPCLGMILEFMGAGSSTAMGIAYGNIVFVFMFVFIFAGVAAAILRAEGDVNRAMYAMAITAILNMIIDPIFIYIFNMGIVGAAWATVLSSLISCIVMGYWIWGNKSTYLTINREVFNYSNKVTKDICSVAIPSMAENFTMSVLIMCVNTMLTIVAGTTAVAVYTSAARINQFAMIPLLGIGTAMLTVTGAAYGARNYEKLKEAHRYSILLGYAVSIVLSIIMFFGSDYIALLFAYTPESAYLAPLISSALKILCLFLIAMPAGIMSSMSFQGVGKGLISFIITVCRAIIFEIICAYILGIILGFGEIGVYSGLVLGCCLGSILSYTWFKLFLKRLIDNYNQ